MEKGTLDRAAHLTVPSDVTYAFQFLGGLIPLFIIVSNNSLLTEENDRLVVSELTREANERESMYNLAQVMPCWPLTVCPQLTT